jgi:hypothetical protein
MYIYVHVIKYVHIYTYIYTHKPLANPLLLFPHNEFLLTYIHMYK